MTENDEAVTNLLRWNEEKAQRIVALEAKLERMSAPISPSEKKLLNKYGQSSDWCYSILAARAAFAKEPK